MATKFGNTVFEDGGRGVKSDPQYVREACERILKKLGFQWIDLFYCHRVDRKTPVEKTVEAMAGLKRYVWLLFPCWFLNFFSLLFIPLLLVRQRRRRKNKIKTQKKQSYFRHEQDRSHQNREEKVSHLGLSEVSSTTLRRAHAVHSISAVQIEYSLFTTDIKHPPISLFATARSLVIATVTYLPIGRGFVTGFHKSRVDFALNIF